MNEGKVKWFDLKRGYGFIRPFKKGEEDVFIHITDIRNSGYKKVEPGNIVEYNIEEGPDGKPRAKNITLFEYVYE